MKFSARCVASFLPLLACLACSSKSEEADLDDAPTTGGTSSAGGATASGGTGGQPISGTGGVTGTCTAMCEHEVTTTVPVETATCSAAAYVVGTAYTGGQTVSLDGNEYTAKYWTDTSPAGSTGADAWSAASPCPSKTTMQEVTTTEMVCCDSQGGTGGATSGTGGASGGTGGTGGGNTQADCVLDQYLPGGEADFKTIMAAPWPNPQIHAVFSNAYSKLCEALSFSGFSDFAQGGTEEQNKRELAAFLANVAVETAYLQDSAQNADYNSTAFTIGRGAIQLTYDYNYQAAADYLGNQSIMSDPRVVATDPVLVWETALWFWMHYENPSVQAPNNCHQAIKAGDFGRTLRIIKGDCGSLSDRVNAYQKGIQLMGVTAGDTTCEG